MANVNVGGRVEIKIGNEVYHPVAEVKIVDTNVEVEVVDNQDGTIGRSVKSSHFELDMTIRNHAGLNVMRLFSESFDLSCVEREMGRSILLTNAFAVGRPERNTVNGEISGVKIVSSQYQVV